MHGHSCHNQKDCARHVPLNCTGFHKTTFSLSGNSVVTTFLKKSLFFSKDTPARELRGNCCGSTGATDDSSVGQAKRDTVRQSCGPVTLQLHETKGKARPHLDASEGF